MSPVNFKYTIPITKSTADEDGLYIEGAATGPEVDLQDERIAPEAIADFARQIKDRHASGDPIPYYDEHDKGGRSVLKHLGDLVDGSITEKGHLWVRVRLNDDNPAATFLYRQINAGKKYGMSVSGDVPDGGWADELVKSIGKRIRTFKQVILTHIANTTRPVWTPSFGTVLNRAIEKALSEGETMAEETVVESTKVTQETTTETPAEETVETATAETTTEETTTDAPAEPEASPLESKIDALVSAFGSLVEALKPQTPAPATVERAEETPEPAVNKSESDDRFAALEAELAELKARSSTPTPPVITKAQTEEFEGILKAMSPQERLRIALAAQHGEEF